MQRRTALARLGTLLIGGFAGCLNDPPGNDDTASPPTPNGIPTASFEVIERSCGQGTNSASVGFEDARVRVDGTIGGSDTCDTAALETVDVTAGRLELAVATVRETTAETPVCGQCLTDIDYRATVGNARGVDTVVVRHDGERVAREERS